MGPVMLDVVDHPGRCTGVTDDRVHRSEQGNVDRADGAYGFDGLGHRGVEDRDESGPAVTRCVAITLELDEDDVGLIDTALRVLHLVVGHLDRHRGMPGLGLVFQ